MPFRHLQQCRQIQQVQHFMPQSWGNMMQHSWISSNSPVGIAVFNRTFESSFTVISCSANLRLFDAVGRTCCKTIISKNLTSSFFHKDCLQGPSGVIAGCKSDIMGQMLSNPRLSHKNVNWCVLACPNLSKIAHPSCLASYFCKGPQQICF